MRPSCAISIDSTEISFFEASKSGPSHLHTQPLANTHLAAAPSGPICVMVPLKRLGVCRPLPLPPGLLAALFESLKNDWRSFHKIDVAEQKPCFKTMLGNLVRPMSLR